MHELSQIAEKIKNADAILIGASNGLSITEGLHLFADKMSCLEILSVNMESAVSYMECRPAGRLKKKNGRSGAGSFIITVANIKRVRL